MLYLYVKLLLQDNIQEYRKLQIQHEEKLMDFWHNASTPHLCQSSSEVTSLNQHVQIPESTIVEMIAAHLLDVFELQIQHESSDQKKMPNISSIVLSVSEMKMSKRRTSYYSMANKVKVFIDIL
ncbi:hypothetical protein T4D_6488 [Trichinella pseudospiralis]|uniref:Uncharacterized protein n=1 Tax=Trichinella pseudospiralis TaxID=6337 RepID=A0A0V1FJF3_TRIPS|nr:hypothetical protein T4D_6488 [Trichinella pseudospiralis]